MAETRESTSFTELKVLLGKDNYSDLRVFRHCIGFNTIRTQPSDDQKVAQIRSVADQLAEHMVVVCIDTEHYTLNSDEMTEIGVAVMPIHDIRELARTKDFGDHGENLMQQTRFHFWRLREKAHLPTTNTASRGPEGNRFGEARFVTFAQAREFLRKVMNQPIKNVKALQGYKRPVVVLGHSIAHDREHLNGKDLDLGVDKIDTIVRYIDTQTMATEAGYWWGSKDPMGLKTLVEKLEFEHSDSHTAANDVGRTLISAFLLALPKEARSGCLRSVSQVARDLEHYTRNTFVGMGSTRVYCCNCGSTQHMDSNCPQVGSLRCDECVSRGLTVSSTTHITFHCPIVRDEVAAERLAWYAGQPSSWSPKYPFSSKDRLQTFAEFPDPKLPKPTTAAEITARRAWYDKQRGSDRPLKPFVWYRRGFKQSRLRDAPPPPGQRHSHIRYLSSVAPETKPPGSPSPSIPLLDQTEFPPLPSQEPIGAGSGEHPQSDSVRGGRRDPARNNPRTHEEVVPQITRGDTPVRGGRKVRGRRGRGRGA